LYCTLSGTDGSERENLFEPPNADHEKGFVEGHSPRSCPFVPTGTPGPMARTKPAGGSSKQGRKRKGKDAREASSAESGSDSDGRGQAGSDDSDEDAPRKAAGGSASVGKAKKGGAALNKSKEIERVVKVSPAELKALQVMRKEESGNKRRRTEQQGENAPGLEDDDDTPKKRLKLSDEVQRNAA
jgi:hypothetical protein